MSVHLISVNDKILFQRIESYMGHRNQRRCNWRMQQTRWSTPRVCRQRFSTGQCVRQVSVDSNGSRFSQFVAWQMVCRTSDHCCIRPAVKLSLFVPWRDDSGAAAVTHKKMSCFFIWHFVFQLFRLKVLYIFLVVLLCEKLFMYILFVMLAALVSRIQNILWRHVNFYFYFKCHYFQYTVSFWAILNQKVLDGHILFLLMGRWVVLGIFWKILSYSMCNKTSIVLYQY